MHDIPAFRHCRLLLDCCWSALRGRWWGLPSQQLTLCSFQHGISGHVLFYVHDGCKRTIQSHCKSAQGGRRESDTPAVCRHWYTALFGSLHFECLYIYVWMLILLYLDACNPPSIKLYRFAGWMRPKDALYHGPIGHYFQTVLLSRTTQKLTPISHSHALQLLQGCSVTSGFNITSFSPHAREAEFAVIVGSRFFHPHHLLFNVLSFT